MGSMLPYIAYYIAYMDPSWVIGIPCMEALDVNPAVSVKSRQLRARNAWATGVSHAVCRTATSINNTVSSNIQLSNQSMFLLNLLPCLHPIAAYF